MYLRAYYGIFATGSALTQYLHTYPSNTQPTMVAGQQVGKLQGTGGNGQPAI